MGLMDDPLYRKLTEGEDTRLLVGTLGIPMQSGIMEFPLFLIDYHGVRGDMESFVADIFDDVKKVNLNVRDGVYFVSIDDQSTVTMFAEGETAVHTSPDFWGEFTPAPDDHARFQREFSQKGVWLLVIITKANLREILVDHGGKVGFQNVKPMTDPLRKMWGVE